MLTQIIKPRSIINSLTIRQLLITDVDKCLALQESLNKTERKFISMRSREVFNQLTREGVMMGAFSGDELIAQSGTNLINEEHSYIKFEEATKMNSMPKVHFEVGASIVLKDFRGMGLQSELFNSICERVEELKQKEELLFTAACNITNLPSALNMLKAEFKFCGITQGDVPGCESVDSLVFARPSKNVGAKFNKVADIDASIFEETNKIKEILKSGKVIGRDQSGKFFIEELVI